MKFSFLLFLIASSLFLTVHSQTGDEGFFSKLYAAISDIVTPDFAKNPDAVPASVFLMELPGLAVGREDMDPQYWANANYQPRFPDAVFADFVDRVPNYASVVFADTGRKISNIWSLFMHSYKVPPNDDPAQLEAVAKAETKLYNSSLESDFLTALDAYQAAQTAAVEARDSCVTAKAGGICAYLQTGVELRLSVSWFNMEVRRRSLLSAQAAVLTLQTYDLKSVFAEALMNFERSKRIDIGGDGFGAVYYNTFAQPRNWWTWFPISSYAYDYVTAFDAASNRFKVDIPFSTCKSQGAPCYPAIVPASLVVVENPTNGLLTVGGSSFTYTAYVGFTGGDVFSIKPDNTTTVSISVGVASQADAQGNAAFVAVSATDSSSSSQAQSSYSSVGVNAGFKLRYGLFSASGSTSVNVANSRQSYSQSTKESRMAFSIAKVSVVRPWLDPLLLQFKPVGVVGYDIASWSDGSGVPQPSKFLILPVLPTSFIVARDIEIGMDFSSTAGQAAQSSVSTDTKVSVGYGPFFSGRVGVKTSNGSQSSSTQASTTSNSMKIVGPQVIGWVCTPLPSFPNAAPTDKVFNYRPIE